MRIGVISDTHGDRFAITRALSALPDVDAWIHLGDVVGDAKAIAAKCAIPVHCIRGNCDFDFSIPQEEILEFGGVKMLICHGHQYGVRYDRTRLFYRAEECGCALALYGHTHISMLEASGAILALNPGSPSSPREGRAPSVALIRIENGEAYPEIKLL